MSIDLPKDIQKEAVASIIRYFDENREERIGNIAATSLLEFFLAEIGPSIYNKAIADVQERMQIHVLDIDVEFHEEEPLLAQVRKSTSIYALFWLIDQLTTNFPT